MLRSPDAEAAQRAQLILAAFGKRRLERALVQIQNAAKDGQADLLAERLVRWQGVDDEAACWQAVLDVGHKLLALDREKFQRTKQDARGVAVRLPKPTFRNYFVPPRIRAFAAGRPKLEVSKPPGNVSEGVDLARGERVVIEDTTSSLILATESARLGKGGFQFRIVCRFRYCHRGELPRGGL